MTPYHIDRATLVQSEDYRRLSGKPQAMGKNRRSGIRTRMSHSQEVAINAAIIAAAIGADPVRAETAGLLHDIGHPPYGHNGEEALDEFNKDYGGFEGNAQNLRIVTKLAPGELQGRRVGLNFTRGTLDAGIKYAWIQGQGPDNKQHKYGAYVEEADVFEWIRQGAPARGRCLEAQIMDWSDDVAYAISDFEDVMRFGYPDDSGSLLLSMATILDSPEERTMLATVAADMFCDSSPDEVLVEFEKFIAEHERDLSALRTINTPSVAKNPSARQAVSAVTESLREQLLGEPIIATLEAIGYDGSEKPFLERYDANLLVPQKRPPGAGYSRR